MTESVTESATESGQSTADLPPAERQQQRRERQRQQWFAISAALFGWLGLVLQLMLLLRPDGIVLAGVPAVDGVAGVIDVPGPGGGLLHAAFLFFSDYTHWAALVATLLLSYAALPAILRPRPLAPALMTAAAVYVTTVLAGYHFLLHDYHHVTGVPQLTGNLLHYVLPLLFLMYWWLFVAPSRAGWRQIGRWAAFPLAYAVFAVATGAYPSIYAYRYGGTAAFGVGRSFVHAAGFMLAYLIAAWVVVLLERRKR